MQYCSQCSRTYPPDYRVCPRHNTPLEGREELEIGMVVREKYKILDLIGNGAMGRVWLVEDLDFTYKKVQRAMKVPLPHLIADPAYVQRFRDEAAKAGVLNHPNVVRTEHIDRTESGTPFLLMELVEGRSLRWWIDREPHLQWQHSVEIARQVALALEAAHTAGLVHCDIKPENVLAVSKAAPYPLKVTDFGLAKATSALTGNATQLHPGTTWGNDIVAGTPEYISPEQALSRGTVGTASDVYSLGVMTFEMLAGALPYGRIDSVDAARRAHEGPPPTLHGRSEWPRGLAELVSEMLVRDPNGRPSASAIAARLGAMLQAPGLAPQQPLPGVATQVEHTTNAVLDEAHPPAMAPVVADTGTKSRKRQFVLIGALGVAVLGLAVLAAGFLSSSHSPQPQHFEAAVTPSPSHGATTVPAPSDFTPLTLPEPKPRSEVPKPPPPASPPKSVAHNKPGPALESASEDADSLDKLGTRQLHDQDRDGARESFGKAARLKNAHSMVMLGAMYSEERNYADAAKMFREAAELRNPRGMYNLGVLYETGKGVPYSLEDAVHWYALAERIGDGDAAYRLGIMYERGAGGVPKDLEKAKALYQRAGTPEATKRLAIISSRVP